MASAFTVFILFFGLALIEAFASGHWFRAAFFAGVGVAFLLLARPKKAASTTKS